jgi:sec-independent protein translocase protein TatB
MFDIGITKILLVAVIALIVVGPERLPVLARTLGTILGRARGYLAEVKAEVNRSIELEELKKMRDRAYSTMHDMEDGMRTNLFNDDAKAPDEKNSEQSGEGASGSTTTITGERITRRYPVYIHPEKNWPLARSNIPNWYKARNRVRKKIQSCSASLTRNSLDLNS